MKPPAVKVTKEAAAPRTPKEFFAWYIQDAKKNGNGIVSDKTTTTSEGIRKKKVVFEDGGKLHLHLHKTGVMIRKFPDGKKVQCNSDGKQTTVCSRHAYHGVFAFWFSLSARFLFQIEADGTRIEINPDGTKTVHERDGSIAKYSQTGELISRTTKAPASPGTPPQTKHFNKPDGAPATPPSPLTRGLLMLHEAVRKDDTAYAKSLVKKQVLQCDEFDALATAY